MKEQAHRTILVLELADAWNRLLGLDIADAPARSREILITELELPRPQTRRRMEKQVPRRKVRHRINEVENVVFCPYVDIIST